MDYSTIELLYYLTYSLLFIVIVISVYSILKYVINKETKNIINIYYISSCGVFISYLVLFFHFYDSEIDTQLLLLSSITMSENQIYSGFTANIHRLYLVRTFVYCLFCNISQLICKNKKDGGKVI